MKRINFAISFLLACFLFLNSIVASAAIIVPDNVTKIINKSCYSCHSTNSKDTKAKEKMNFDKFKYLKTYQIMAKWDKISEVAVNDEMPPKKFKKKHPEKALTMNDLDILTTWVNNMTDAPAQPTVTLDNQLENLINQIVSSLAQNDKSKIAVMDFVNMNGEITKLGRYMSEELTTRLYLTGKFEVIERKLLDKIVEEQKISLSGMIDESSAVELGRVLGVDAIASGTITDLGTSVKVNARLISAESGKLFSVASVEIPKNDKVKVLLSQSVATATVTGATTSGNSVAEKTTAVNNPVVTRGSFKYEILETRINGESITCKVKLSGLEKNDTGFRLFGGSPKYSIIYDDLGNEYYLKKYGGIKYANKLCAGRTDECYKVIIAGTSINIELYFENKGVNPKSATKITLLRLNGQEWTEADNQLIDIEFRNIPLKKY